jgi:hypothetical protein
MTFAIYGPSNPQLHLYLADMRLHFPHLMTFSVPQLGHRKLVDPGTMLMSVLQEVQYIFAMKGLNKQAF